MHSAHTDISLFLSNGPIVHSYLLCSINQRLAFQHYDLLLLLSGQTSRAWASQCCQEWGNRWRWASGWLWWRHCFLMLYLHPLHQADPPLSGTTTMWVGVLTALVSPIVAIVSRCGSIATVVTFPSYFYSYLFYTHFRISSVSHNSRLF